MLRMLYLCCCVCLTFLVASPPARADQKQPLIGQSEHVYTLASENTEIRGLAFDGVSPEAPRLFVLDRSGWVFAYKLHQNPEEPLGELTLVDRYALPRKADQPLLLNPRGLAFTLDHGRDIFYVLNWDDSQTETRSQLWRCNFKDDDHRHVDLTRYPFRIGQREILDLTYDNGTLSVCFDASAYRDRNLRVQRGIIQLRWPATEDGQPTFTRHLPDSGEFTTRGLAAMQFEGAPYLWATAGNDYIYAADAQTGRGLFYFERPTSTQDSRAGLGLAFGDGALWVPEHVHGPDHVHRVNVTRNLDTAYEGPRVLRHLVMTIRSEPEQANANPGVVYHYYSRPYAYGQLHNQGVWPDTETVRDTSDAPNAMTTSFTYDPAGDTAGRQYMSLVEYADAPARTYTSRYEIDIWTNPYRKYVYPHRVDRNTETLAGTDYLADDPNLYNLSDTTTYDAFVQRVRAHIQEKYGVPAEMDHPYWAPRNVLEYIQDHYYYPSPAQDRPATVDYARNHYDANPGNLKIALSDRDYDKTQIIACSGTSVMLAGAMRYLGLPARWLGTGTPQSAGLWDANHNGLLDEGESAPCTNGHRYTQVWLGSHYGWICFDATPSRPESRDYDVAPPIQSQWRYMNRAARGHREDNRIVFNVGSELFLPLYRVFEYDERLARDNNCGGDQRYNLQGRADRPELWKLPRHRIAVENVCFIEVIELAGPKRATAITWKLKGHWARDPQATISVYLQQFSPDTNKVGIIAKLAEAIRYDSMPLIVDLSCYSGRRYRLMLRKDGDSETGGCSPTFDLN